MATWIRTRTGIPNADPGTGIPNADPDQGGLKRAKKDGKNASIRQINRHKD
jgi:hypothetical protein